MKLARPKFLANRQTVGLMALTFLSGMAGLGYEMVWTQMLSTSLGHEVIAVFAVVAAFFVGLSLGAWVLGTRLRHSTLPQRWYAALEFVIGAWAIALLALIPQFNQLVPWLLGAEPSPSWHWVVSFIGPLVLLLPATTAMGATLPALERMRAKSVDHREGVAGLYAANTFGAVGGTLLGAFWLAPRLGYSLSSLVFAGLNFLGAVTVLFAYGVVRARATENEFEKGARNSSRPITATRGKRQRMGVALAVGILGIGYEILVVRMLSQVFANTVYTFAALMTVYLFGTATGAGLYQWRTGRLRQSKKGDPGDQLLVAAAWSSLIGCLCLYVSPQLHAGFRLWHLEGIGRELLVAAFVFAAPTVCLGALFAHLAGCAARNQELEHILAANTAGGAIAPALVGIVSLPEVGPKLTLAIISTGYLLLLSRPLWSLRSMSAMLAAAATLLIASVPIALEFTTVPQQGQLLAHKQGVMGAVSVVSDRTGARYLKVNNHFTMGGTASPYSDHRQAHIPLLLHGAAQRALFLGVGTGITLNAAREYPGLQTTAVELIPEVLELRPFFGANVGEGLWHVQPHLLSADARRYVLSTHNTYDVVIADLFHPSKDGAAALYTKEHFAAVRALLADNGLFCQWLPLYQLDLDSLRTILRTFVAAFPYAQAHLGHFSLEQPIVALIGSNQATSQQPGWLEARVHDRSLQRQLVNLGLNSNFALYGGFLANQDALRTFAGEGPLNTDDWPVIAFASESPAQVEATIVTDRLLTLVEGTRRSRLEIAASSPTDFSRRLARYWMARDAYLRTGKGVHSTANVERMLEQIKKPLLEIVRLSADFSPAYAPLLGMANGLFEKNPKVAGELLVELAKANPLRPEAGLLLRRLSRRHAATSVYQ